MRANTKSQFKNKELKQRKGGKHAPYKSTRLQDNTKIAHLNTAIIGRIGENRVENHLLENDYQVFNQTADTWGIDLVCFKPKLWKNEWKINLITIQVKYHTIAYNTSYGKSLKVNITENHADWIAVPIDRGFVDDYEHIIYYPNEKKGIRHVREFSFKEKYLESKYKNQNPRRWATNWYKLPTPKPQSGWNKLIQSRTSCD